MKQKYHSAERLIRRQSKLRNCLLLKGGICKVCKRDLLKEPWNVAFHHRNRKDKTTEISQIIDGGMHIVFEELKKCDLLCHYCHRKTHFNTELFEEHYEEICQRAKLHDGKRYTKLNYEKIYELAKLGVSSSKIAKELGRGERQIRHILRDMSTKSGENLIQKKEEWLAAHRKVTDAEIISAYNQGMFRDEMEKKFDICNSVLSRRISRLKKFGLLPKGQRKGYCKRTTKKYKKVYSYVDAQKIVKSLGIITRTEYRKKYKEDPMLPSNPEERYKVEWQGWPEFTGFPRYRRKNSVN
jgi:transposase